MTQIGMDMRHSPLTRQVVKVISGGQVGADIAGLRAAKALGIETGGWMPKGWKARDGKHPEYAELYGMHQHPYSYKYPPRTMMNVIYSDGTIRFATDFFSAGERCTLRCISKLQKPYFDIDLNDIGSKGLRLFQAIQWIRAHNIQILNVAGNANPEIELTVEFFLTEILKGVNHGSNS